MDNLHEVDTRTVEERIAQIHEAERAELIGFLKDGRQEILTGIVGYLGALTNDGESELIDETRLFGLLALVRAFHNVDGAISGFESPTPRWHLREMIDHEAAGKVMS